MIFHNCLPSILGPDSHLFTCTGGLLAAYVSSLCLLLCLLFLTPPTTMWLSVQILFAASSLALSALFCTESGNFAAQAGRLSVGGGRVGGQIPIASGLASTLQSMGGGGRGGERHLFPNII